MSGILNAIAISSQGLSVQRSKMNVVAKNIANAETTETKEGGPYRRQQVIVSETKEAGSFSSIMRNTGTKLSTTNGKHISGSRSSLGIKQNIPSVESEVYSDKEGGFRIVHDPSHPSADADGYVKMPDVNIVTEMVDMMAATRAYEANTVAISSAKQMARDALEI